MMLMLLLAQCETKRGELVFQRFGKRRGVRHRGHPEAEQPAARTGHQLQPNIRQWGSGHREGSGHQRRHARVQGKGQVCIWLNAISNGQLIEKI